VRRARDLVTLRCPRPWDGPAVVAGQSVEEVAGSGEVVQPLGHRWSMSGGQCQRGCHDDS
jgi:hypothetical protein